MSLSFTQKLHRLAELIVMSAGVKKGSYVLLNFYPGAEELARAVAGLAYRRGASFVHYLYEDPSITYEQLTNAPESMRNYFSHTEALAWEHVMLTDGCAIQLRTELDQDLFGPISERLGNWEDAKQKMRGRFRTQAVERGQVAWTLVYVPSQASAKLAFPELSPQAGVAAYWDAIFAMTFVDQPDWQQRWQKSQYRLVVRREELNRRHVNTLHFTSPGGTDLKVGLTIASEWLGGARATPTGRTFTANVPTFEVYTTPDWRTVEGVVLVTKPVLVEGVLVEDLQLEFVDGEVVEFSAASGEEAMERFLATDDGARRAGEIALVDSTSPVAKQGRLFKSIIYDENAACHLALGMGYITPLKGAEKMDKTMLVGIGRNDSVKHTDFMISDETTTVKGLCDNGDVVTIIENGLWTELFA